MKRTLLLILVLCLCNRLFSNPIGLEEAKNLSINFYSAYAPAEISNYSVKDVYTNTYNNEASFYTVVFNAGGFVMISADDNALPILGYSFTGSVKKEIENSSLAYKFDCFNKEIDEVKKLKAKSTETAQAWSNLRNKTLKSGLKSSGPLLTTKWDQEPLFNKYCPNNTPTGCVATAMAQIMHFYKWPATGQSWNSYIPSAHPEYGKQYADFAAGNYDWGNMKDTLSTKSSSLEVQAIATLMYHCGVSVNMNYAPTGSGAASRDVMFSLANYFFYDRSTLKLISFNLNQKTSWFDTIKYEIDHNRVVYYSGSSKTDGGHAWVCDGYDNNSFLHINWGWSGYYNGYFSSTAMSPGTLKFTENLNIIVGIKPGNPTQDLMWTSQASGFTNSSRGIRYISPIDKRTAWAVSYDGSTNSAHVKDFTRTTNGGATWTSGTISLDSTTDYEASMIYAVDDKTAWVPLFGPSGGGKIAKTIDGGSTWTYQQTAKFTAPDGFPNVIHFWDKNNGFCMGDPNGGYFEIYTTNNGGETWNRVSQASIPAKLNSEAGTIGYYDVVGDTVWFSTTLGRIFRSTNKGYNWEAFQTPITNASFEISFKNANTGIIQIRKDTADNSYITHDGGQNWATLNHTGNFYINSFKFVRGTNLLISTGSDYQRPFMGVSYSTDDGSSFTDYADYYKNFQFLSLGVVNKDAIWAGSYNSDKYSDGMWHFGAKPFSSGLSTDKVEYCMTDQIKITDQSVGNPDSWIWNFGDGATPATGSSKGPYTINYSTSGSKTITVTTIKGTEEHKLTYDNIYYIAGSKPLPPGNISGSTLVNSKQKITYTVPPSANVTFNWILPTALWQGNSTTNTIQVYFSGYAKSDTLRVSTKNSCGVSDTSELAIKILGSLAVDNVSKNDMYVLFPNPSKDNIFIKNIKNSDIQIFNNDGKLVINQRINSELDEIPVSKLPGGIYYLRFMVDGKPVYKPFSKL